MWVVDTCIVLDVLEHDPQFGRPSAELLQKLLPQGLAVSPVTMVELSAAFAGNLTEQKRFLDQAGISYEEPWTAADTEQSHAAWNAYLDAKRQARATKRPVADILIGGFAVNRTGLVTRHPRDFSRWFPRLTLQEPRGPSGSPWHERGGASRATCAKCINGRTFAPSTGVKLATVSGDKA